jgi:Flagellar biosynthesis protein, FliO
MRSSAILSEDCTTTTIFTGDHPIGGANAAAEPKVRRQRKSATNPRMALTTIRTAEAQTARKRNRALESVAGNAARWVRGAWCWLVERRRMQMASKRLCLCETLPLGEKRFLAIVKVEARHFLVAGTPGSLSLLAELDTKPEFAEVLRQRRRRERMAK